MTVLLSFIFLVFILSVPCYTGLTAFPTHHPFMVTYKTSHKEFGSATASPLSGFAEEKFFQTISTLMFL